MHAEDARAFEIAVDIGGGCWLVAFCKGQSGEGADHAFAREAEEHGIAESGEGVEVLHGEDVPVEAFGKADAWVEDDVLLGNAADEGAVDAIQEVAQPFTYEVAVVVVVAVVHDADRAVGVANDKRDGIFIEEAPDVVDHVGTVGDGFARCGAAVGVHGEGNIGGVFQRLQHGDEAAAFFVGGDLRVSGTGGFGADVDDVAAVLHHGEGVFDCGIDAVVASAVGERIRGDVQNAHDEGRSAGEIKIFLSDVHWKPP